MYIYTYTYIYIILYMYIYIHIYIYIYIYIAAPSTHKNSVLPHNCSTFTIFGWYLEGLCTVCVYIYICTYTVVNRYIDGGIGIEI